MKGRQDWKKSNYRLKQKKLEIFIMIQHEE